MNPVLSETYIQLLHQIMLTQMLTELAPIIEALDKIDDNTSELLPSFQKTGASLPLYWISYLRIIKFGLNYKNQYTANYDFFMRLYNHLRSLPAANQDQKRMINELGELLYKMDELSGQLDRAAQSLIAALRTAIHENHNIVVESRDQIVSAKVTSKGIGILKDAYRELVSIVSDIVSSMGHEQSIMRMSRLMAPPDL
ncbi:MAG: hypothetical protein H3C43_07855 [Leptonema sp. (in: Bacteria)]|nr:hypothetical protein [Leptonema sp. (in: bacteria)]